jgi:hypothetical protein
VTQAVAFLNALAQALSSFGLYPTGHRSRERALDLAFERLHDLLSEDERPEFSFLDDEVVYRTMPLREMRAWEWSQRLADAGIQRLQFDRTATREELEDFLGETLARLTLQSSIRPKRARCGPAVSASASSVSRAPTNSSLTRSRRPRFPTRCAKR